MNVPFDITIALTAGAGIDTLTAAHNVLATAGSDILSKTTQIQTQFWLTEIAMAADTACVIEFGYCTAADKAGTFVPVYTFVSTVVNGSGFVRTMGDGVQVPLTGSLLPAFRVTEGGMASEARIAGDLRFWKRQGE